MPDDMAAKDTARKEHEQQEFKLLEEVVRQAETRLAALAQTRQMMAAKATSVMTWTLTLFIAVSTALVATSGTGRFANARWVLAILLVGGLFAVVLGTSAALSNLWSRMWLRDGWQHAGSNPRRFIAGMPPKEEKRSPVQRVLLDRLRKRSGASTPSAKPLAAVPPPTKKEALRDAAARYTQAIDENEQILASTVDNIAASLSAMVLAFLLIAVCIGISGLFPST